jgi:hypothetical protein
LRVNASQRSLGSTLDSADGFSKPHPYRRKAAGCLRIAFYFFGICDELSTNTFHRRKG